MVFGLKIYCKLIFSENSINEMLPLTKIKNLHIPKQEVVRVNSYYYKNNPRF